MLTVVSPVDRVAALLQRTAEAHHQAFRATDGADPDWPAWYADYLVQNGAGELLADPGLTADSLATRLVEVDRRHQAEAPETPWESYYAEQLRGALT